MYVISVVLLFLCGLIFPIFFVLMIISIFNSDLRNKIGVFAVCFSFSLLVFLGSAFISTKLYKKTYGIEETETNGIILFNKDEIESEDNKEIKDDVKLDEIIGKYICYSAGKELSSITLDGHNYTYESNNGTLDSGTYEQNGDTINAGSYRFIVVDSNTIVNKMTAMTDVNLTQKGYFSATISNKLNTYIFDPMGNVSCYVSSGMSGNKIIPLSSGYYKRYNDFIVITVTSSYSQNETTSIYYYDSDRKMLFTSVHFKDAEEMQLIIQNAE